MNETDNYRIKVIKPIPYVTTFLFKLSGIFVFIFILISILLLPMKLAPSEMKAAFFVLALPKFIQYAYFISWLGFLITLSISILATFKKKALLVLGEDAVNIRGKFLHLNIPVGIISNIVFMDLHPETSFAKARVTIYFRPNDVINFELQHYIQVESFFNRLASYPGLPLKISNSDETRFQYELEEKNNSH